MSKPLLRVLLVALALAVGVFFLRRALQGDPVRVRVAAVERSTVESSVSNTKAGTVKTRRRASVAPEIGGSVVEIACRKGDRVKKGDELVRLDDVSPRAELALAERGVDAVVALHEKACIATERARRELEHNRELSAQSVVSADSVDRLQSVYDLSMGDCKATEAEIARARAVADVARAALKKTVIRAPFDGIVAEMKVEVGEWITPAPPMIQIPTLIDLIDTTAMYVSAPMDEVDSARIQVGQRAKVTLDPYPGRSWPGRVVRIAPYVVDVESQNRTVEIEVEIDDAAFAARLLPGLSADVEVVLDVREKVLRVPTSALLEGGKVLVLADGVLLEKRVEPGVRNWDFTEVRSGLDEGEQIVVSLDKSEVKAGVRAVAADAAASGSAPRSKP